MSKLIRFIKKDEYTHAAIALDRGVDSMYSFGRKYDFFPLIGRFKKEAAHEGVYKFLISVPCVILEVEVSRQQYDKAQQLIRRFEDNSHRFRYNYIGLFYGIFNKPVYARNRFLCSEFVYYILKESGAADLQMPGNLVRPQSLLDIDCKIIYQGNLKQFNAIPTVPYHTMLGLGR